MKLEAAPNRGTGEEPARSSWNAAWRCFSLSQLSWEYLKYNTVNLATKLRPAQGQH